MNVGDSGIVNAALLFLAYNIRKDYARALSPHPTRIPARLPAQAPAGPRGLSPRLDLRHQRPLRQADLPLPPARPARPRPQLAPHLQA